MTDVNSVTFVPDYIFSGSLLDEWKAINSGDWSANDGIITNRGQQGTRPGILVFNESFQDVAMQASIKRDGDAEVGFLFRFQNNDNGISAVLLSIDKKGTLAPFNIQFDLQGNEKSRKKLIRAGGIRYRIAPPMEEEPHRTRKRKPAESSPKDLPVTPPNTDFVNQEWNQLEAYIDVNMIRSFLNDGDEVGGTLGEETNNDGFGPVALYIRGQGEVKFKNIMLKDISQRETPLEKSSERFTVQQISDMYYSWGANAADFNKDGILDVVAGPYVYYGPDYVKYKEIFPAIAVSPSSDFTNTNAQFTYDFDGDEWPDVLTSPFPATLFINPEEESRRWNQYTVLPTVRSEITDFVDIDNDGLPELVYGGKSSVSYAKPDENNPTKPWTEYNVSEDGYVLAHGIGTGDINGDGRIDILNPLGWWEQPRTLDTTKTWKYHPVAFGRYGKRSSNIGGNIMGVYDVNGNGLNDVVCNLNVHGFGLAWYEQKRSASGEISFVRHMISDDYGFNNAGGVTFSQAHGGTFTDIDNDGIKDYVVGKRYFTHLDNYFDPDPYGPPVLYWYRTVRDSASPGGAKFVPELIHNRSGAGNQITAVDLDKNGSVDLITSTNRGTFIYWNNK